MGGPRRMIIRHVLWLISLYFIGLKQTLENYKFFSLLVDGSKDVSINEKDLGFVIVFDPAPPKTSKIKMNVIDLDFADFVTSDAENTIAAVDFSFDLFILKTAKPNLLALMAGQLIVVKRCEKHFTNKLWMANIWLVGGSPAGTDWMN